MILRGYILLLLCLSINVVSCGLDERGLDSVVTEEPLPVRIALGKVAASNISRVELVVSASDLSAPIISVLTVEGDEVVGTVVVPVGSNRVFTINAYDSSGELIYSGQSRTDVKENGATVLPPISVRAVDASTDLPPSVIYKQAPSGEDLKFLLVPAGQFTMGYDGADRYSGPKNQIYLDHYYIGEYEITNDQFIGFLEKFGNPSRTYRETSQSGNVTDVEDIPYIDLDDFRQIIQYVDGRYILHADFPDRGTHPARSMTWYAATLFCELMGARLPTEAEWEKAARGTDGRRFSWGDRFEHDWANVNPLQESTGNDMRSTTAVGSHTHDRSPYGAYDMVGNVREWCQDWYLPFYHYSVSLRNPTGPDYRLNSGRSIRGASLADYALDNIAVYHRGDPESPWSTPVFVGFRCACDP